MRFVNLAYWVSVDEIKALITLCQSCEFVPVLTLNSLQLLFPPMLRSHSSADVAGNSGKTFVRKDDLLEACYEEKIE